MCRSTSKNVVARLGELKHGGGAQSVIACPGPVRGYNCSTAAYSESEGSARQPIDNRTGRLVVVIP